MTPTPDRPARLSPAAWDSNAEWARDHERMQHYCADAELERKTDPRDPWRAELHRRLAARERGMAEDFAWYAALAESAATNAKLEELRGTWPNAVAVPGRTLADQVREDGLRAARHDDPDAA